MCDKGERWQDILVNSWQSFGGEESADRSTDDSYLIAQIAVNRFSQVGALFWSSVHQLVFLKPLSLLLLHLASKGTERLNTHCANKQTCTCAYIFCFHRKDMMTKPFSDLPHLQCTRITWGPFVILNIPPHLVFMRRICTGLKEKKICFLISFTGQDLKMNHKHDWNLP